MAKIEESFKHINENWKEEEYKKCLLEWNQIQPFISKKQTPYQCYGCNTYWKSAQFINDHENICPKCDIWCQPFLCNPINYQSVLKYINPAYHKYLLPLDLLYCKRCYITCYTTNIPSENCCHYCEDAICDNCFDLQRQMSFHKCDKSISTKLNELCNRYGVAEYSGDNYYYDDIFNNHNQNDLIFTCLMIAIRENNIHSIQKIMSNPQNQRLLFSENRSLKTPFYYALENRHWEIAMTFYKMGSNINHRRETFGPMSFFKLMNGYVFEYGSIYEFLCAKKGLTELTEIMLNDKCISIKNFFKINEDDISPLMIARINKNIKMVNYLDEKYIRDKAYLHP